MRKVAREILITALLALVIFLAIRSVVHNFEVSGNSMVPNLQNGQFVIVSKAAYWFSDPERGDIVVFHRPGFGHGIIHRIVGLPGEKVEIRNGEVYVNDRKLPEPYIQGSHINRSAEIVPQNKYLIVGDNRYAASADIVARDDIVGKAWLSYWPLSEWGRAPNYSWKSVAMANATTLNPLALLLR
ncbi:MAG: signal peptidase I [Chloroflexi bacterium]|nr:signal peptidase I [Chloroflexota bacterium]